MSEIQSASHRVVPEIEHLLENAISTNIHDLGSHTVSVTHLDLEKKNVSAVYMYILVLSM